MVDGYYYYALDKCMKLSNDKILLKGCGPPLKQIEGVTEMGRNEENVLGTCPG